jgi:leucine dehydrogenase
MTDVFDAMIGAGAHRILVLRDDATGLRAIIAIDSVTLGPALGGIRTQHYANTEAALEDVSKLAAAMTRKCAIAGLDAGGGKAVVLDHPGMDRARAFRRLGAYIEELGGLYRCAGDLGTTQQDLLHVAQSTQYCNTSGDALGDATGITIVNGIRAAAAERGITDLSQLSIAVQGCGLIGASVARAMAAHGARVSVADVDSVRAKAVADEIGGGVVPPENVLMQNVDVVSPCAIGGVLTPARVDEIRAWAICGGANNQLSSPEVADLIAARGIAYVPDFLASSGAVIRGGCLSVMHTDPAPLLAAVEGTARAVLRAAADERCSTVTVAERMARQRIARGPGASRTGT